MSEIKTVLTELRAFKPCIHLQGGEVLVRRDIVEILRHLASLNMICGFTTNGTLITSNLAKEIVKCATVVSVSVDGPEQKHEKVRGKGSYGRAIAGMEHLLSSRGRAKLPILKMNVLWHDLDYKEIKEILEIALELGIDTIKFGDLQFVRKPRAEAHKQTMRRIFGIECKSIDGYVSDQYIDVDKLWHKFVYLKRLKNNTSDLALEIWNADSRKMLMNWYCGRPAQVYDYCYFPWFSAIIRYNGDVVPCGEYRHPEYVAGNVKRQRFKEIWNGKKMRQFRQTLRKVKFFPGCDRCCGLHSYAR